MHPCGRASPCTSCPSTISTACPIDCPYSKPHHCAIPCLPAGAASLRQRLHQLLTPLLRLVLALVTALPNSGAVREQALAFVDSHARTLTRILHEAASPGIRQVSGRANAEVRVYF